MPRMHRIVFLILLICMNLPAFNGAVRAQIRRELRVIDADTRKPLPFVALQSLISGRDQATTSDVEGRFYWLLEGDSTRIEARCVGYGRQTFTLRVNDPQPVIALQRSTTQLPEISVKAGENPAHRIIQEAIRRKKEHDPSAMGAHRCMLYHRFMLTIDTTGSAFTDTIRQIIRGDSLYLDSSQYELAEFVRRRDLLLSESIVLRHYPGTTQPSDRMLATRTSGLQSPLFAVFSAQMQNFSIYNDPIQFNDLQYVGPLSPESPSHYRFHLEESLPDGPDTLHVIQYSPKPRMAHKGLSGTIYIHSSSYAVQQVTAEPADIFQASGLRLSQLFHRLPDGRWYPLQTHTDLRLNQLRVNDIKVIGQVFTQYHEVQFGTRNEQPVPLDVQRVGQEGVGALGQEQMKDSGQAQKKEGKKVQTKDMVEEGVNGRRLEEMKDVSEEGGRLGGREDSRQHRYIPKIGMTVLEDAAGQPFGYFEPFRPDSLNGRDQETYRFIDSFGTATRLEQKIQWGESLLTGKIAMFKGRMGLNLPDVLSANRWEGLRLGVGLSTGDSLARRIRIGGYSAYGFGDRTPKFGGFLDYHPGKHCNFRLRITARNDLRVNGGYQFFHAETALFNTQPDRILTLFNRFYDHERVAGLQFRWLYLGPWSGEAGFLVGHRQAALGRNGSTSNYRFINNIEPGDSSLWPTRAPSFTVSEWSFHIRYALGETTVRLPGRSYTLAAPGRMPVLSLAYERGLPIQPGSVNFHRLLLRAECHFGMRSLGDLDAVLNLGTAWGPNPLPIQQLLFVRGTGSGSGLFVPLVFQTFDMVSFAGNRIASIHLQHRTGMLRLTRLKQSPLLSLHYNAGWSHLSEPEQHQFVMNETSYLPLHDLRRGYFEGGISLSCLRILGNNIGVGMFYGISRAPIGQLGTAWLADGSYATSSPRRWAVKLVLTP